MSHSLWWNGPDLLRSTLPEWSRQAELPPDDSETELVKTCHIAAIETRDPLLPCTFSPLTCVTAWVIRFINNCHDSTGNSQAAYLTSSLSVQEIVNDENYWLHYSQMDCLAKELKVSRQRTPFPLIVHPFWIPMGCYKFPEESMSQS